MQSFIYFPSVLCDIISLATDSLVNRSVGLVFFAQLVNEKKKQLSYEMHCEHA